MGSDTLRGVVERLTYHNEENGYTVAKVLPERPGPSLFGAGREVTVVGNMLGLNVGESVELIGRWTVHGEYGRQFQVETFRPVLPATIAGMEKYLGSGLIQGVGPVTARRIVEQFGLETLTVIEKTPERLAEVPGVGARRVELIQTAWAEQRAIKEVMLFLQGNGISTSLATRIYKQYGDHAITVVRSDPYRLARDVFGIGFLTADKIARALGMADDAPERVAAGVTYALNTASEEGHVFLPTSELVKRAAELLDVVPDRVGIGLARMWQEEQIKVAPAAGGEALTLPAGQTGVPQLVAHQGQLLATQSLDEAHWLLNTEQIHYLTPLYYSEVGVARGIHRLLRGEPQSRLAAFQHYTQTAWSQAIARAEEHNGFPLAPQQRQIVQAALTHRVTVLTGGPGTGKTTTVRALLDLCEHERCRVLLAAPTGRAAKRLAETTGAEAKTLHRLLAFKPGEGLTFERNSQNPLDGDLLIVDEASMLDLVLTNHLLKAIPSGMHLLLVGDIDQLPSVGPGSVLKDLIAALEQPADPRLARAAVIRLQTIFRQAANSWIITNAHRINAGELPVLDHQTVNDFFLFKTEEAERAAELCVELVTERIPRRFGIPTTEIQVLSPMHRGAVGVAALNSALQNALNPAGTGRAERMIGSHVYRVGDRVMQIRNNYDKEVYNGDMGQIAAIDSILHTATVRFDGRAVQYAFLEMDELTHAYAVSVHKSQGSEFPAVVIPLLTAHALMLQRNLLYTAVTRARQLVVLVGQPRALALAVNNHEVAARYSGLTERLLG